MGMKVKLPLADLAVAYGLPRPVAEYRFYPGRKWQFDLAWAGVRVALEVEGGIYGRGKACPACGRRGVGAHTSVERLRSDMEKYNSAAVLGWRVIRARPEQVNSGEAFRWVRAAVTAAGMAKARGRQEGWS